MHKCLNKMAESIFGVCVDMVSGMTILYYMVDKGAHPRDRLLLPLPAVTGCLQFFVSKKICPFRDLYLLTHIKFTMRII